MKNTEKYDIIINTVQRCGNDSDTTEGKYSGSYTFSPQTAYISYTAEGSENTLMLSENSLRVFRKGNTEYEMRFVVGESVEFDYVTEYGTIPMVSCTEEILSELTDNGGVISAKYTLDIQGITYYNNMVIKISKKTND